MTTRAQRTGLAAVLGMATSFVCTATALGADSDSDLPVTVVAIRTDDAYPQAGALTKALRNALREVPGWTVGEGDFSLEVLTLGLKCGDIPDATCQTQIADQIKSDRYIWGALHTEAGKVKGELHLWIRSRPLSSMDIDYDMNLTEPNDDALRKIAQEAVTTLTGGPPGGTLRVRIGASDGQVFIDGKPIGTVTNGDTTFNVPAGPHRVLVQSTGYLNVESAVVVKATGTSTVELSQLPVPVDPPVNWKRIGGYVGIGAGVAFGTVAIVSAVKISNIGDDADFKKFAYLFPKSVKDICSPAEINRSAEANKAENAVVVRNGKDLCDKADTSSALTYVFFPLAAVSAGVGAYLVLTSGEESKPPARQAGWFVQPAIGLDRGKVDLTYRW